MFCSFQMLEDLINAPNDDSDYYKTPPLGRHYTLRWAQEDLQVCSCLSLPDADRPNDNENAISIFKYVRRFTVHGLV